MALPHWLPLHIGRFCLTEGLIFVDGDEGVEAGEAVRPLQIVSGELDAADPAGFELGSQCRQAGKGINAHSTTLGTR